MLRIGIFIGKPLFMLGYIGSPFPDRPSTMPRWFDATGTATQSIYRRFHSEGVPTSLYHYTTTAALISIIEKNAFWLSDATYLNDRSEIEYGAACALDRLRLARCKEADETVATMLSLAIETLETKPHPPVYICCFSWQADDLGQWRGYGKGGTPVSIELDNTPTMFGRNEGMFSEVRYEASEQSWIFDEIVTAYRQAYAADILEPRFVRGTKPLTRDEENALCADKLHVDC